MFNISLTDFTEHREERLEWYSPEHDVRLCIMKGLNEVSLAVGTSLCLTCLTCLTCLVILTVHHTVHHIYIATSPPISKPSPQRA